MKLQEGIDFFQDCLMKCGVSRDAKEIFAFKSGTKGKLEHYQTTNVFSTINDTERHDPNVRFVVKYLLHQDMFVVWDKNHSSFDGKYYVYKNQLINASISPNRIHTVTVEGYSVYIFSRIERLGIDFIRTIVYPK